MKMVAMFLLGIIDSCLAGPVVPLVVGFLRSMRIEQLADALNKLAELERAEQLALEVERCTPQEAKALLLAKVRFELRACRAAILRRFDESALADDERDYLHLLRQRSALVELEPALCRDVYLEQLRERVLFAEQSFKGACETDFA